MNCCENHIKTDGAKSISIILPCFESNERFYEASRINKFYESAAASLYSYATECIATDARRAIFSCKYEISYNDDKIRISLRLSLKISGKQTVRKSLSHTWQNGYIISKEID